MPAAKFHGPGPFCRASSRLWVTHLRVTVTLLIQSHQQASRATLGASSGPIEGAEPVRRPAGIGELTEPDERGPC